MAVADPCTRPQPSFKLKLRRLYSPKLKKGNAFVLCGSITSATLREIISVYHFGIRVADEPKAHPCKAVIMQNKRGYAM